MREIKKLILYGVIECVPQVLEVVVGKVLYYVSVAVVKPLHSTGFGVVVLDLVLICFSYGVKQ